MDYGTNRLKRLKLKLQVLINDKSVCLTVASISVGGKSEIVDFFKV